MNIVRALHMEPMEQRAPQDVGMNIVRTLEPHMEVIEQRAPRRSSAP